jgi:hypothetical protein
MTGWIVGLVTAPSPGVPCAHAETAMQHKAVTTVSIVKLAFRIGFSKLM